jgi:DNA-directed RNA polymerase subunit M/transcription elongation factor TFIIS
MICKKCYALMIPHIEPTTIRWTCSNCNNETTERRYTDAEIERVQAAMADAGLAGDVATIEDEDQDRTAQALAWWMIAVTVVAIVGAVACFVARCV